MEERQTRRRFLELGAAGVLARPGYVAASDSIRVGVIGSGGRGEAAAMNAMNADPGVKIVAMGDIRRDWVMEKRSALKVRYAKQVEVPDSQCFAGFDAYQKVIACSDAVIIANAAKFHPLHLKAAIQAGKHVFVEKPHAIDPAGIHMVREAVQMARQKGLSIVSGLQSRYHPGYLETIQQIHDGAIGDIVSIQETWLRPPYVLRERKPGQPEIEHQACNQYHFHWLSGDDVPQTLIHNLDRSSWALGDKAPLRAWGMGGRSSLKGEIYGNVFDHHAVTYEFDNGVRVYAFCRTIDDCYNENSSYIMGTKGRCDLLTLTITGEKNWKSTAPVAKNAAYDLEHVAFFKAIRAGKPLNNGDYMIRSTLITLMGQFACYTGQQVTWEQLSKSRFEHKPGPAEVRAGMQPPVEPGPGGIYPLPYTPGVSKIEL